MSSLTSLHPPGPGVRETISDSGDKLGELVNQLDKVKIVNGDVEEENNSTGRSEQGLIQANYLSLCLCWFIILSD